MEKSKRVETVKGEIPLPEVMIQHIQSYLSGRKAARTTVLSKSWYKAWLTRPALDFDERFFFEKFGRESSHVCEEFANKTMQRYRDLNLSIESFRLCIVSDHEESDIFRKNLIVGAMKMGATDVELRFPFLFPLPQEVLGSETLLRLSITCCKVDGSYYNVSCSRLKSLALMNFGIYSDDVFEDIIQRCISMEELSLSNCFIPPFILFEQKHRRLLLYPLHKLRRLYLELTIVEPLFFTNFASRFPCLKDLTILECPGPARIQIASNSFETISIKPYQESYRANFHVPNIRKFTYSGSGLPHLSIKGGSREWDLDISIACNRFHKISWFLNLKKLLTKFRLSRISLSITVGCKERGGSSEHEVDIEAVRDPLVVENLTMDAPSSFCSALLVRFFRAFRPKFITAMFYPWRSGNGSLDILCKKLISDQNMQFGLKKVKVEVYEMVDAEWRPLVLEKPLDPSKPPISMQKIRFELIWD